MPVAESDILPSNGRRTNAVLPQRPPAVVAILQMRQLHAISHYGRDTFTHPPLMSKVMDLSVLVPTYNEADDLAPLAREAAAADRRTPTSQAPR
jgi:hypothetical protein